MDHFNLEKGKLFVEEVAVSDIATTYGTPCYVYSRATLTHHMQVFDHAFGDKPHLICYAVKANSNIAILNILAKLGSGFDIVSQGELARVLKAGGEPSKIVFSGVGKLACEIERALEVGIYCFNVESAPELEKINEIASQKGIKAPVALRINLGVDAKTHPYITTGNKNSKFGIPLAKANEVYQRAKNMSHIEVKGIHCHIGSQITSLEPFAYMAKALIQFIDSLQEQGIKLSFANIGGGLGICYDDETPPTPKAYLDTIFNILGDRALKILIEPGRAIVANAGILVTQVQYLKEQADRRFAIVDAGMNDLVRPALYTAWHDVVPVQENDQANRYLYDVVGPVCESGDFLAKDRSLAISSNDWLAIRSAGAYGFSTSSNYNSRPRAAEILVDGDIIHEIRKRETIEDLYRGERQLNE